MKKCVLLFSVVLFFFLNTGCRELYDYISNHQEMHHEPMDGAVLFFLSDSLENIKTGFHIREDVFFHFGIINHQDSVMHFTKSHGGPPVVRFVVYQQDRVFGSTDEGYAYPAIVTRGQIAPHDTLKYAISWYSNPYHENDLEPGDYYTVPDPYIRFDDFDIAGHLDTLCFEIRE